MQVEFVVVGRKQEKAEPVKALHDPAPHHSIMLQNSNGNALYQSRVILSFWPGSSRKTKKKRDQPGTIPYKPHVN